MLKNYINGPHKCVLIVDHAKLENYSKTLVGSWPNHPPQMIVDFLPEIIDPFNTVSRDFPSNIMDLNDSANLIFPIAELSDTYKLSSIFHLVNNYKKNPKIKQIFLWASVKNISNDILLPYLDHMANVIVTIKDRINLAVLIKKPGGSVTKKLFKYKISNDEFDVTEVKKEVIEKPVEPTIDPESLATFKINFEEDEIVARNALKLPYEKTSDEPPKGSKIIYQPDSDDDFDEEDPDEDLDF